MQREIGSLALGHMSDYMDSVLAERTSTDANIELPIYPLQ